MPGVRFELTRPRGPAGLSRLRLPFRHPGVPSPYERAGRLTPPDPPDDQVAAQDPGLLQRDHFYPQDVIDDRGEAPAGRFGYRPLTRADFPTLSGWLARPHVETWWHHDPSPAAVEKDFAPGVDGEDPVEYFVVSIDGTECAFVQSCQLHDEDEWWRALQVVNAPRDAITVDYFIGEPPVAARPREERLPRRVGGRARPR